MLTALEAGMESPYGPYKMRPAADNTRKLDGADGTPFTADQNLESTGKAIGSWSWEVDGQTTSKKRRLGIKKETGVMRTVNWTQQRNEQVGQGWVQTGTMTLEWYCALEREVVTMHELSTELCNKGDLEAIVGFDMPTAGEEQLRGAVKGGTIKGVTVTIYYVNM